MRRPLSWWLVCAWWALAVAAAFAAGWWLVLAYVPQAGGLTAHLLSATQRVAPLA